MRDHRVAAAWLLAITTAMLLVASLSSTGTGPWGVVILGHMAFAYALVAAAFVFIVLLARPSGTGG